MCQALKLQCDCILLGDELIPALPSEIKSEHEDEIIDQRLVYR